MVAAPDREQSAVGTAVTLRHPLRAHRVTPQVQGVETYAVEGTPGDAVILGIEKLFPNVDLVVSGINQGLNLGDDVLISGTVGAALQGYLRGLSAIAVSTAEPKESHLENSARLAALLARRIHANNLPHNLFLNINVPSAELGEIGGINLTRLAVNSHTDTVDEGHDGKRGYFWLVRRKISDTTDEKTDIGALANRKISITALSPNLLNKPSPLVLSGLCLDLFTELSAR